MTRVAYRPEIFRKTIVDVLREQVQTNPNQTVYTFLTDGELDEKTLTYSQTDQKARLIAAHLQDIGPVGQRVLLICPPGLDYITAFLGCLYAGAIAVPAYPPDITRLARSLPRFLAIVEDAEPSVVLTTTAILQLSHALRDQYPQLNHLHWLATDNLDTAQASSWVEPAINENSIAFLQYTSGSTAVPKGVILTHNNLLHNQGQIYDAAIQHRDHRGFVWLPPYHDLGLIGGIMQPLFAGFPVFLMSPLDFLQQPRRWLQAITRHRITISGGPNFAYDLCVRKTKLEERATFDLSHWQVAFNGAEPVRAETMQRFVDAFASCGFRPQAFYPCYGLAEATLFVTGGDISEKPVLATAKPDALAAGYYKPAPLSDNESLTLVSCGRSLGEQEVAIVNTETNTQCREGQIGEIWVAGPSIAQGYWQRALETETTFQAYLADTKEGPFLRTGDLGFLWKGELFISGRLKDLIIVDGLNHYPQDIELTAENSHPALRRGCSAAFATAVNGIEKLVVAIEVARPNRLKHLDIEINTEALIRAVSRAVAVDHDLKVHEVVLLKAGTIHKTSSGKIQRRACRDAFLQGEFDIWESVEP